MENYDPRNRDRESARGRDDDRRDARSGRGWLEYERDYGRSDQRTDQRTDQRYDDRGRREEQRYGPRSERSSFSPDWSREGAEPMRSDDPYYARNREGGSPGDYNSPDWPYDRGNRGRDIQRSREDEQDSHYRGYYSRSSAPFSYPGGTGYLYSESWTLHGPYTGRGPKGYKRSDQQIIDEACQRLERDGEIDASEIEVTAEDGVLRLRGTVQDRRTKRRAEECVESVYGARDVMNELRVESQGSDAFQGSQESQRSQSGRGSQASQSSQSSSSTMRAGSGASAAEQSSEDKKPAPKH